MITETIPSRHGYPIPCLSQVTGSDLGVILCHGFGSGKASPTNTALQAALTRRGVSSIAFDWPGHGDSPDDGSHLRVGCCLDDLAAVEDRFADQASLKRIVYFGSSFGAYLTLLYGFTRPHRGQEIFSRSAAVDMAGIFRAWMDTPLGREMARQGFVTLGEDMGYPRQFKVTQAFFDDLEEHDLFSFTNPGLSIRMVHGQADDVASPQKAAAFAQQAGAQLTILPGGEHRLLGPGQQDFVIEQALAFFQAPHGQEPNFSLNL